MPGNENPVLYIHPYNHVYGEILPFGAVAALNALPLPKLGRYAGEVRDEEVRAARVILLDCHWFLALAALEGMVRDLRRLNPAARIVAGGLTAAFYGRDFLRRFGVDAVVGGDVEETLPRLLADLVDGREPPPLPGVWVGDRDPPPATRISPKAFDELDWVTLDWFPSCRQRVVEVHREHRRSPGVANFRDSTLFHPIFPAARGCRRQCDFCCGSYQDRVFGPECRVLSPGAFVSQVERVAADPALAFVSAVFMDSGFFPRFARAMEGRGFPLDAFLYLCGDLRDEDARRMESGFTGRVTYTIVQPQSLAPLQGDRPMQRRTGDLAEFLASVQRRPRVTASVHYFDRPPAPEVEQAARLGGSVFLVPGEEWRVTQPDQAAIDRERTASDQLETVLDGARRAAAGLFLARLVPSLTGVPLTRSVPIADWSPYRDPFHRELARVSEAEVLLHHAYGVPGLDLRWSLQPASGRQGAWWGPPGSEADGPCEWDAALRGYAWAGEVEVGDDAPQALGVVPVVRTRDGAPLSLASWKGTVVPTVEIPAGPRRRVRVFGKMEDGGVRLEVVDGLNRESHLLPAWVPPTPAWAGEAPVDPEGRGETGDCGEPMVPGGAPVPVEGQPPFEAAGSEDRPWPSPRWPAVVEHVLRKGWAQGGCDGWCLGEVQVRERNLFVRFEGPGAAGWVAVFPRSPGHRHLGTPHLSVAYHFEPTHDVARHLVGWVVETLARASRRVSPAAGPRPCDPRPASSRG